MLVSAIVSATVDSAVCASPQEAMIKAAPVNTTTGIILFITLTFFIILYF
jgi:hypothetical protein